MKKLLVLIPILFLSQLITGQNTLPVAPPSSSVSSDIFQKLNISQERELMELVNLHIKRNQQGGIMKGFRVEIFFSSELNARQKAQNIKNEFLTAFPDYNVYITYVSPDFIVRVGDFRTKNEALRFMKEIQGQFPKAFVVPDLIELPKLF